MDDDRAKFAGGLSLNLVGWLGIFILIVAWPETFPPGFEPLYTPERVLLGLFSVIFIMTGGYVANQQWQAIRR